MKNKFFLIILGLVFVRVEYIVYFKYVVFSLIFVLGCIWVVGVEGDCLV